MRQKSYPNPNWQARYCPWKQKSFIEQATSFHQTKALRHPPHIHVEARLSWFDAHLVKLGRKTPPPPRPLYYRIDTLEWLYKIGRDFNELYLPFDLFCRAVTGWPSPYTEWDLRIWKPSAFYLRWRGRHTYLDFRQRHQHAHVPKKVRSEEFRHRQEWREKKKFHRDKSKGKGWRRGGSKRWVKKQSNKYERQHVRQCLQNDQEILPHRLFRDTWMWD